MCAEDVNDFWKLSSTYSELLSLDLSWLNRLYVTASCMYVKLVFLEFFLNENINLEKTNLNVSYYFFRTIHTLLEFSNVFFFFFLPVGPTHPKILFPEVELLSLPFENLWESDWVIK